MDCKLPEYAALKKTYDKAKNGVANALWDLLLGTVAGVIGDMLDEALGYVFGAFDLMTSIAAVVTSAINAVGDKKAWAIYIMSIQKKNTINALNVELQKLNLIINRLESIKDGNDAKDYGDLSVMVYQLIKDAYSGLDSISSMSMGDNPEYLFKRSRTAIEGIVSLLSEKDMQKYKDDIVAYMSDRLKGENDIKVDSSMLKDRSKAIISEMLGDTGADVLRDWRYNLITISEVIENHYGISTDTNIGKVTENVDSKIATLENKPETVTSSGISSGFSSITWKSTGDVVSELLKEMNKTQFDLVLDENNSEISDVVSARNVIDGGLAILKQLRPILNEEKDVDDRIESINNFIGSKKKIIELMDHEIFQQIRDGEDFTTLGKNDNDEDLIDDEFDKIEQLTLARGSLLGYRILKSKTVDNAVADAKQQDLISAYNVAMAELEKYNSTFTTYKDLLVKEYKEQAFGNGVIEAMFALPPLLINVNTRDRLDHLIEYYKVARSIAQKEFNIVNSIPDYEDPNIETLMDTLNELGMGTLVSNLQAGMNLINNMDVSSMLKTTALARKIGGLLDSCVDMAKTPNEMRIIRKWDAEAKDYMLKLKTKETDKMKERMGEKIGIDMENLMHHYQKLREQEIEKEKILTWMKSSKVEQ